MFPRHISTCVQGYLLGMMSVAISNFSIIRIIFIQVLHSDPTKTWGNINLLQQNPGCWSKVTKLKELDLWPKGIVCDALSRCHAVIGRVSWHLNLGCFVHGSYFISLLPSAPESCEHSTIHSWRRTRWQYHLNPECVCLCVCRCACMCIKLIYSFILVTFTINCYFKVMRHLGETIFCINASL